MFTDSPRGGPAVVRLAAVGIRKARFVNVTVENIGPCKRLLRVEADVNEVEKGFEEVIRDFLKHATLPGFRPGKAPKDMVVRRFEKEIKEEAQNALLRDLYKQAVEKENLKVYHLQDVEVVSFGRGQPMQFTATVEITPEFQLPNYKQIPVTVETRPVTEADVDKALEALRQQQKKYQTVERPATAEDVVVIDARAMIDGQPLSQKLGANLAPYETIKGFWVGAKRELGPNFFAQLVGAKAGDKRTVQVTYPADFSTKELAGKTVTYEVDIREVRCEVVPPMGDELAKEYGAENLAALREGVRKDLENEAKYQRKNQISNQVVKYLIESVNFDLPETAVQEETRGEVYNRVARLQQSGLSPQDIEQQKDKIFSASQGMAYVRVKLDFILGKIAQAENLNVTKEELGRYLSVLAYQRQANPAQFLKEIEQSGEINTIVHRLLMDKTMDFLVEQAQVTEVAAATTETPATPPAGGA
ncbi:MAG: trigger factor [Verrucomicrobiae bacterium]|nr:trigger factor [Verrucomicrobiae bacterium]